MRTILDCCRGFPETSCEPGTVLIAEGTKTGRLYVLIEGEIRVWKGTYTLARVSEPGAVFGELSLLLDTSHTATVEAHTACKVYVVENAREFLRSDPDITYQLATLLAQRQQGMTTYLVDLKRQYGEEESHLGMVDDVLKSLIHQQNDACSPGSDRYPDTSI